MRSILTLFFCLLITLSQAQSTTIELEKKINALIAKMSLEEKIGQTALRGTSSRVRGNLPDSLKEAVRKGKVGAFLNVMNTDFVDELQEIAVKESPHGIPLIFSRDIIHGYKTIFPIPLGLAATFNPEMAKQAARVSAFEGSSMGIRWTFAPMLDIARDSRWGRVAESPGEDPYLASELAKAYIEGFQGDDLSDPTSMIACAKHFLGYGAAIGGRDYNTAIIHEPLLHNVYIPPFKAAIDAGAQTVMTSFNELNGVPASGSEFLLKQVLREGLGFNGFVVSDWNSVTEMIPHGFAASEKHAAELAAKAGMDMEMTSQSYEHHIKTLIDEGKLTETELDDLVRNILRVKWKMKLFESPYRDKKHTGDLYDKEHLRAAKEAAIQSMVLLKNEGILPLSPNKKIALIGPMAHAPREQLGTWTFDGDGAHSVTPRMAFKEQGFVEALKYSRDTSRQGFDEARALAKESDVILFFGGEEAILSGEAHSRADISLPGKQEALIQELAKTGKPIVLIIMAGRPITITNIIDQVDAVLMAWHPGTMAGTALHEVIMGKAEPQGRLPITWPKAGGQLPLFYNHKNTGRPANEQSFVQMDAIPVGAWQSSLGNNSHYLDLGFAPHFPFGYGLTYTDFGYSNLKLSNTTIAKDQELTVSVNVTNTGDRKGVEIVQLYVQDVVGSMTRPIRELKGFQKIELDVGETKTVTFTILPEHLKFVNTSLKQVLEEGQFNVWLGPNAHSGLKASFELKDTHE